MGELFKPLYHDTDSVTVSKSIEEQNKRFLRSMLNSNYGLKVQGYYPLTEEQRKFVAKCFLNAQYGTMVTHYKENDMRIKDFIVLHADNQPIMIKKDAITTLSRLADGTVRIETTNQIWVTDDKYEDVIKRLFEV